MPSYARSDEGDHCSEESTRRTDEAWSRLRAAADFAAARGSLIFDLASEAAHVGFAARWRYGRAGDGADGGGYRVIAFDAAPLPRAIADAHSGPTGQTVVLLEPGAVPARAATLASARRTVAMASFVGADRHAAIVVPVSDPQRPIEGYALAVGTSMEIILLQGHWRIELSSDGHEVTSRTPFAAMVATARVLPELLVISPDAVPNKFIPA